MTTARTIVDGLGGSWNGGRGIASCPAHNDRKPSLSVSDTADGKVLVKCHAGCSQTAVIDALRSKRLWPKIKRAKAKLAPSSKKAPNEYERLQRAYIILRRSEDAGGTPVETYLRRRGIKSLPPNILLHDRRAAGGKYVSGLSRFPAMVAPVCDPNTNRLRGAHVTLIAENGKRKAAVEAPRKFLGSIKGGAVMFGRYKAGQPLLIGEGVEEALTLREVTGLETWSALSAGNMGALNVPAKHREVIVCANNDDAGLQAATKLAERLAGEGHTTRLAVPEQDRADWNDLLRAKTSSKSELRQLILEAPVVDPPDLPTGLKAVSARELCALDIPPRRNLLAPWLPEQGLVMIHAPRGIGKTYLSLGVAYAVALGKPFLRWTAAAPAGVLYLDGELPAATLQERCRHFDKFFEVEEDDEEPALRFVTPDLQATGMPDLGTAEGQRAIDSLVDDDTRLIVIDPLTTLLRSGEENAAESWLPVQTWALKHRAKGRSVLFVHHSGKTGKQRGTSRREDVLDTVVSLKRPSNYSAEEGAVFEIEFEKARHFYGADAETFEVRMGLDEDGMTWADTSARNSAMATVVEMLNAGASQTEIAVKLDLSRSRVSQLAKQAKQRGLLKKAAKQKNQLKTAA